MAGEAIFIGYRRDDTADVAGRIYDAMAQRFGRQRIFKDVDNIGPGVDFGDYIKSVLPRCRVALVLIGPHWLDSKDESGKRRIDDAHDWVRIEIETALATPDLLVVPVLVNGARMPRSEDMPESLTPLLRRNAAIIRRDPDFHDDVERLATALRASVNTGMLDLSKIGGKTSAPAPRARERKGFAPLLIGGVAVAALVVAAIIVAPRWFPPRPGEVASVSESEGEAPLSQSATQPDSSPVNGGANQTPAQQPSTAPPTQTQRQDAAARQTEAVSPPHSVETSTEARSCSPAEIEVYFGWDSYSLVPDALATIDDALSRVRDCSIVSVQVVGHTDTELSAEYNMRMSERRASVVRDALVRRGVPASLIVTEARGESDLAVATPDGVREPINRRVRISMRFR